MQVPQTKSFDSFISEFKTTLKSLFHEENDINKLSVNRGLPENVLSEIMACNPLSVSIPTEFGGRGNIVQENLTLLSAASYESLALSLTFGINSALFLQPVAKYGQSEAKAFVFDRFMKMKNMGGLMITEPGFGSDALNMQTSFVEEENSFHLKGTKHWAGLTGQADFWLLTARKQAPHGGLMRDVDFFICDNSAHNQQIVVEEYFENLGLYQIPYGRNILDVKIPKVQRLIPHTTGVQMMLDLLHRSRLQFPGMGLGFIQRMLDEAIAHAQQRAVGGKSLYSYDQVQQRLARLQADYTICSAFSLKSVELADIKNDLTPYGLEANIIKTVTTDLMQDSAQSLLTLVGAAAYKLNHVAGRGIVDSRPFQIFEGSNDILYIQIGEALLKLMKVAGEKNLYTFLKGHSLTSRAADIVKDLVSFDLDLQQQQRKLTELGRMMSRIASMNMVIVLGEKGFRQDMINGAISMLRQEVANLVCDYNHEQSTVIIENYQKGSIWQQFV
ncbi:MAG: acyl-CoA/acyl-ACP dehydrogenase [Bacteroidales bacterium]|nr:acyl-CoA/acyl-ACP dehydrogenase [Bacteroidales bacterium]